MLVLGNSQFGTVKFGGTDKIVPIEVFGQPLERFRFISIYFKRVGPERLKRLGTQT
ncbi:hypothetical protein [Ekhidna sp.]|uniref:hypothetical protein n=1 Tax=Ekhidna sp. TaxID=2608089 RepID=UPI0032EBC5B3